MAEVYIAVQYEELTQKVIGCAYEVYNKIGFGFLESVYENCLMIELKNVGLRAQQQKVINVCYGSELVGEFKADVIVDDVIILELKSVRQIIAAHEVQLVNYLVATGKPVGLLLNFAEQKLDIRRKVKDLN